MPHDLLRGHWHGWRRAAQPFNLLFEPANTIFQLATLIVNLVATGQSLGQQVVADQHSLKENHHERAQIPPSHLAKPELRGAPGPAVPGDWNLRHVKSASQHTERHFQRDIEVAGVERAARANGFGSIGLEGVRQVIELCPEHPLDAAVDDAIYDQFQLWIVLNLAASHESRVEYAIVSFLDLPVVSDDIVRIIRTVGHVNHDDVSVNRIQAGANGPSEACRGTPRDQSHFRILRLQFENNFGCPIGAVVIDHDGFQRNAAVDRKSTRLNSS